MLSSKSKSNSLWRFFPVRKPRQKSQMLGAIFALSQGGGCVGRQDDFVFLCALGSLPGSITDYVSISIGSSLLGGEDLQLLRDPTTP